MPVTMANLLVDVAHTLDYITVLIPPLLWHEQHTV
jgi:hypothetical protein